MGVFFTFFLVVCGKMSAQVNDKILTCRTTDCNTKLEKDPGRNNKLAVCELGCNEACEDKAIDIFRRWNAEMIRRKKLTKKPRQKV